jgi:four helix bundle protein
VKSMLYLAKRLNFADENEILLIQEMCEETSKILRGLIKSLENR